MAAGASAGGWPRHKSLNAHGTTESLKLTPLGQPALFTTVLRCLETASLELGNDFQYSSCRRHQIYGSDCGQPGGESSQVSCRPRTVQSSRVKFVSTVSKARSVVK